MTVSELIEKLGACEKSAEVSILVEPNERCVGGTPCVGIERIAVGFDWDCGKVFILPNKKLVEVQE